MVDRDALEAEVKVLRESIASRTVGNSLLLIPQSHYNVTDSRRASLDRDAGNMPVIAVTMSPN
jgi:hypothetical protein